MKSKWHSQITLNWKILKCTRSKPLDELTQIVGDPELLELRLGVRVGGRGIGDGERGELSGNDVRKGEGEGFDVDLIGLFERRGFDQIGLFGGLSSELLGFLGRLGDQVGDGDRVSEGLGFLCRFFCETLGSLP